MRGVYDGSSWTFSNGDIVGDAGVAFQITSSGQVQYFSDATKGAGIIKFRAKTIDQ